MPLAGTALLKFRLLAEGVYIDAQARAAWQERFSGPLTLSEYATTSGVALALPGDVYVNAPVVVHRGLLPELRFRTDQFWISDAGTEMPVEVIPVPAFHAQRQPDRHSGEMRPLTDFGVTHTDRCRVSPIAGCAWKCHFCDLPYEFGYRKRHEENLLAVIQAAMDDPLAPARHVLVSGGTPRAPLSARPGRPAQDDEAWMDGIYAFLAAHSPLPVDVMMAPRRDLNYPSWLRSAGINMLSINLEVSDPAVARRIAPAKAKLGRGHTLRFIEAAVDAFGVGFVQSLIVCGSAIEPLESTLRGVQDIVDRGCIPVLSAFRPHPLTPLAEAPAATVQEMITVYERTLEICERADVGILPGPRCIPCHHNTLTLPDDSPFYVGLEGA